MFRPSDLREREEAIRRSLEARGEPVDPLEKALDLDEQRRDLLEDLEANRHRRNEASERIGELKREGRDDEAEDLIGEMTDLKETIQRQEDERDEIEESFHRTLLELPNILRDTVPEGEDESDNRIEEVVGEPPDFDYEPRPHWELAEEMGLLDMEQARTISGSRFAVHHGNGARLERALINFMLDLQTDENGYEETHTPVLVRPETMEGTGQLPKFERDMFATREDDLYLIPTSEVTLVNLYRDSILDPGDLPLKKTAFTPCFRREAGAHGRDTRGLMRQHQFNKVELVMITEPGDSDDALEELVGHARSVLDRLELPYRQATLCSGDTGFAAAYTYDLEVWIPSQDRYREISSCSNCEAFQARRAGIQYRPDPDVSAEYCHTLNGSGIAVGRCWLALLENFQNPDGTVTLPDALRPYMDGQSTLT